MKFKSIDLLLTFIEECKHTWDYIVYLHWTDKISDIRYNKDSKLWYIYIPVAYGPEAPYKCLVITEEGHTIYLPDCRARYEYNGDKDNYKAWTKVDNDDATYDMVGQLMLNDKF